AAPAPPGGTEVAVMRSPPRPFECDKKPIPYDWMLHIPGERAAAGPNRRPGQVTLTVYIPNPNPPPPADPRAAARARSRRTVSPPTPPPPPPPPPRAPRRWIADLGSDDFKVRERAAKELA